MSPTADTAVPLRRQVHRAGSHKIVPAVPLKFSRLSRPTKPVTPVETSPIPETPHDAKPQEQHSDNADDPLSVEIIGTPPRGLLTPESKAPEEHQVLAPTDPVTPDSAEGSSLEGRGSDIENHHVVESSVPSYPQSLTESKSIIVNGECAPPTARTELPPPFYPSEKSLSQATSYTAIEPSPKALFHIPRPSVDGIVFGATQDSPALPSTPYEIEQDGRVALQPVLGQSPGLLQPGFPHPSYQGPSHNLSGAQAPWIPPAVSSSPHDGLYLNGGGFHGPQLPAHGVYDGIYQDAVPPGSAPVNVNGVGRSHSPSPAKLQHTGTQPTSEMGEDPNSSAARNGSGLPPFLPHDKFEVPFELAEYILSRLGNREFADYNLCVHSSDAILFQMPVHAIIVARSQPIASAIQRSWTSSTKTANGLAQIDMFTNDPYLTADSIAEGIQVLYGNPLFPVQQILYGLRPFRVDEIQGQASHDARKRMAQAIGYTSVGRLFQMRSLQKHGNLMIRTLMRWDTIEQVIEYALNESIYARPRNNPSREATTQEEFDATNLLERDCAGFIAFNIPSTFKLDRMAPELRQFPRLPHFIEDRPVTHNPRLSRIRFGDVPPEDDLKSDYITRVLSSILLSLPLALLDGIFGHQILNSHLGIPGVERLMHDVIDEREIRRQKVLNSGIELRSNGISQRLVDNMLHQEQLNGRTLLEKRQHTHL
ncbi:hypothetical protein B0J11DRAFT_31619 [Dendryphion nanum]|uniref:Uncharacterized protein n=1 Tax=Dendryphion nanum TaxID=256645 RepID=A0A9P9EKV2_9PLEO|nr:hypothetical protein B0J11DRAFT_31619 [Dendryphion nanum]